MKKLFISVLFVIIMMNIQAQNKSSELFDKMKSLKGKWVSKHEGSKTYTDYEVISNGSAIMETMHLKGNDKMVTMYHLDNEGIVVTHYCAEGNQPRMAADLTVNEPNTIDFRFKDVTNLKPGAGYMSDVKIILKDKKHFIQEWTSTQGEEKSTFTFNYERVK